jgi:hypothetical protein
MTNHDRETPDPPIALCCCGTPLVSTFEVPKKEWYCVTCKKFYEWLHARRGNEENPSDELQKRLDDAKQQYDTERERRIMNSMLQTARKESEL